MKARNSFCAIGLSVVALFFATPAMAAKTSDLFEMMDQLDKSDKQDFQAAIDKANACTRARNFPCSTSELARAAKAANSGQDKKTLLASQNSLANEKQQLANEIRRAEDEARRVEEERQAQIRRVEEERQARVRRDEEREQARVRRDEEREARRERDERQARDAEDRQSTSDAWASVGAQIRQRGAENAALLGKIDRQTSAAIANSNRVLAAQAAERDRARSEREDREADRRRDAERERSARADAERSAERARTAERQAEAPKYQPQVVILPKADMVCPPGSTWYNPTSGVGAKGGTCYVNPQAQGETRIASNAGSGSGSNSGSNSDRPVSASGTTTRPPTSGLSGGNTGSDSPTPTTPEKRPPKTAWGPVKLESIAICRQNTKSGKWECNGALDNQTIVDEPTLESALARQHCSGGTWAAGGPVLKGVQWDAYRCGHSLGAGDFDIVKRYRMITAQRSYMCPLFGGEDRCTTFYDGQDKR